MMETATMEAESWFSLLFGRIRESGAVMPMPLVLLRIKSKLYNHNFSLLRPSEVTYLEGMAKTYFPEAAFRFIASGVEADFETAREAVEWKFKNL